jgi:hypothetical protein
LPEEGNRRRRRSQARFQPSSYCALAVLVQGSLYASTAIAQLLLSRGGLKRLLFGQGELDCCLAG